LPRTYLTAASINQLAPAKAGQRYDVFDAAEPGLGIRVNDKGLKTFIFMARFPGSPKPANPTRRSLGAFGDITLDSARETARQWRLSLSSGLDPQNRTPKPKPERTTDMKLLPLNDLHTKGILYSRNYIDRLIKEGRFPKPVFLSPRRRAFIEDEVDAWVQARVDQRGA